MNFSNLAVLRPPDYVLCPSLFTHNEPREVSWTLPAVLCLDAFKMQLKNGALWEASLTTTSPPRLLCI